MTKTIKTSALIIGGGGAGLSAALNLNSEDIVLIERGGSNSVFSPWNMMIRPKEELREKILQMGGNINDSALVDAFLWDYDKAIEDLQKAGIKLRESNIGLIPDYSLPGTETKKILRNKLKEKKGGRSIKGSVENFLTDKKDEVVGVVVRLFDSGQAVNVFFRYAILASGGLGGLFKFTTGSRDSDGSVLALCREIGLKTRDLEFFMFHPFLVVDKRFPRLLISGDILTAMEYEDESGEQFLSAEVADALRNNKHHHIFPQMTEEFYLQSLKGKVYGRMVCSDDWFERFKKENEFGSIFQKFKKEEVEKIELHPAFHFSIGGITINENGQTSRSNLYAAGEVTGGLHGSNRIGGLAILEALIFGRRAALDINEKLKTTNRDIKTPVNMKKVGRLGLSREVKAMAWEALGPLKTDKKLQELKEFLQSKKSLTSQEKLLKEIAELCLARKESIGAFRKSK